MSLGAFFDQDRERIADLPVCGSPPSNLAQLALDCPVFEISKDQGVRPAWFRLGGRPPSEVYFRNPSVIQEEKDIVTIHSARNCLYGPFFETVPRTQFFVQLTF